MGGAQASVSNLWVRGGFFPRGIGGLVMAMAVIMFSFGGLELVGITAAEADDPGRAIPTATNQVIHRILIFYVAALSVLLSLYPWDQVQEGSSPFVMIFHSLNNEWVATVLNVIVLTAALSVYNSSVYNRSVYCNSRTLLGLAMKGSAPKALAHVNRRGVPMGALLVSGGATGVCVLLNYLMPGQAFDLLMMLVVTAIVINWAMINLTHLKFRRAMRKLPNRVSFPSPVHPWANHFCLAFMGWQEQTTTPAVRKDGILPLGREPVERKVQQIVVGKVQMFAVRGPEALNPSQCHQDRLVLRTGFERQDLKALKEQGIPTAGLLAHTLVSKFGAHLPLYRQEHLYARAGLAIPQSTLCAWVGICGVHLQPLVDALQQEVLTQRVLHADETPVQMLSPGNGKTHRAYLWAYRAEPVLVVACSGLSVCPEPQRGTCPGVPAELARQAGYKASFGSGIIEIGCMAHARREYFELHDKHKSELAGQALRFIAGLYEIEREVRNSG